MSKKDEALKLALEALERMKRYGNTFGYRSHEQNPYEQVCEAITALKALAEQPAQQEPVTPTAVEVKNAAANLALMREMWGNADEPVAKVNDDGFIVETGLLLSPGTKLYTSPPAQRKPLTLGQKQRLWSSVGDKPTLKDRVNAYGLAIEAAHGIKEKRNEQDTD